MKVSIGFSRYPITVCLLMLVSHAYTQEQLGMRLERFAGLYAAGINPANTAFMPHQWEVSLASAEIFAENNYGFLHNTSVQKAMRYTDQIKSVYDLPRNEPIPSDIILQDFYDARRPMRGNLHTRITGPGFAFRIADKHTFGLSTAVRGDLAAYRIPAAVDYPTLDALQRFETLDINPTGVRGMVWGEVALHYAQTNTDNDIGMAWGITPKYLIGLASGFAASERRLQYTPGRGDTSLVGRPQVRFGMSGNLLDATEDGVNISRQGQGFGIDAGISFFMPDDNDGYAWRVGASLLDFGAVRLDNRSETHLITFDSIKSLEPSGLQADSPRAYTRIGSAKVYGDSLASLASTGYSMGLPTALSIQGDVLVRPNMYVSALLVQRIPVFNQSLRRASTLAVVPRFEHQWLSVSAPLVLNDWQSLRVGLAARLGWLYIGSDNIASFFNRNELSGFDAYVGIKINGFSISTGEKLRPYKGRSNSRRHKQNRRKIKCPEF